MRLRRIVLVGPVMFLWNCSDCGSEIAPGEADASFDARADDAASSDAGHDSGTSADAAHAEVDASVADTSVVDAAPDVSDATVDVGPVCVSDATCSGNPSAPCRAGVVACADGGTSCVDGPPVDDGTTCAGQDGGSGLCTGGVCLSPTVVSGTKNLTTATLTSTRTCAAEAPAFSVTALTATTATVATAPAADCLAAGDEVLLINVQGASGKTTSIGNWELMRVAGVAGTTVTFTAAKAKSYGGGGDAGADDTGIGTGPNDQKVVLLRVPQLGDLTIDVGATLTAAPWDGSTGGIVALRAAKLTVNGTISAAGLGYRSGRWSRDDNNCSDNVATEGGESYTGPASVSTANNGGGAGGISALSSVSFNGDTPMCATSGHAQVGEAGKNPKGRTLGTPGAVYGTNDGTRLTMGSGNAGNLTCDNGAGPALTLAPFTTTAGGIVMLLVGQLDVGAAGVISARANDESRDTAASGGYVYIKGSTLHVGTNRLTAIGATGTSVNGPFLGQTVKAGDGYIVLSGPTVTGTTTPTANVLP